MITVLRRLRFRRSKEKRGEEEKDVQEPVRIPPPVSADGLLKTIPQEKSRLFSMLIEKADCSGKWHKRRAFLTNDALMLARDEDDYIREEISLKCIQQIQVADNNDDPSSRPKASQENVLDMLDDGRLPSLKEDIGVVENERDSNRMKRVVSFNGLLTNGQNKACWHHFDVLFRVDALETTIRFSLRSASKSDLEKMIRILKKARARFIDHMPGASMIKRIRRRLHEFYDKYTSWGIMASLLVANFIVDIGQAEIQPEPGSQDERLFHAIDTAFTVLYVVDLFINLCAHSPRAFFRKGWNILDLIIISLSVVSIATDDGSSINTFRAIRAIRAVRLLTGLPRLREIVNALVSSVSFASIGPSKDDDTIHPN